MQFSTLRCLGDVSLLVLSHGLLGRVKGSLRTTPINIRCFWMGWLYGKHDKAGRMIVARKLTLLADAQEGGGPRLPVEFSEKRDYCRSGYTCYSRIFISTISTPRRPLVCDALT
jgi:hypothetical protein